jgi:hypothetical protein
MISANITTRQRQPSKIDYYVYYDEWTGAIVSAGRTKVATQTNPCLITRDTTVQRIINGELNDREYIVVLDDNNEFTLIERDNVVRLRKKEDELIVIPTNNHKNWDVRIRVFTVNHKMTIEFNDNSIRKLTSIWLRTPTSIKEQDNLVFYVAKDNQPDYLIETFEFDASEIFDSGILVVDVSMLSRYTSYSDLSLLTQRNFKNYQFEVVNDMYVDVASNTKKTTPLVYTNNADDAHFDFIQHQNTVIVNSNISSSQFDDVGLHGKEAIIYITGPQVDQFYDRFELDLVKLRQQQSLEFETDFDLDQCQLLHKYPKLTIHKRKSA